MKDEDTDGDGFKVPDELRSTDDSGPPVEGSGPPAEGVKYDDGKVRFSLLPWDAIEMVAWVFTRGAQKYAPRNWEKGMAWSRIYDGMMRHATSWYQHRQMLDTETGLRQIAQVAWAALVLCAYELRGIGTDDRPGQ